MSESAIDRRDGLRARMAGNIAAGMVPRYGSTCSASDPVIQRDIALASVTIADHIIRIIQEGK